MRVSKGWAGREWAPVALLLVGLLVSALFVSGPMRADEGFAGLVAGSGLALQAAGVVLVFRANRVINFAQLQIGLVGGTLFATVVQRHSLVAVLQAVCQVCVPGGVASAPAWATGVEYAIALAAALAISAGLSVLAYYVLLRPFQRAPRLVLTVATIGLAELLAGVQAGIPQWFVTRDQFGLVVGGSASAATPLGFAVTIGSMQFHAIDLLTVLMALAASGGLMAFLAWSRAGVSIRGAADNPERARTLGIDVDRLSALSWMAAGLLSGIAASLDAMAGRLGGGATPGIGPLVGVLAAALIARFVSVPWSVAAALVLGVFSVATLRWFGTLDLYTAVLIGVIVLVLLLPHGRSGRGAGDEEGGWAGAREERPIPRVLRPVASVQSALRWVAVLAAVATLGLPLVMSPPQLELGSLTALYALLGLSLVVLTGWAGQISLGQFALAAVGAYLTSLLALGYGLPFPLCLLAGGLGGALAAAALGAPALRLRGLDLAVLTLAFAVAVPDVLLNPSYLGAALRNEVLNRPFFFGLDLNDEHAFYYLCLLVLALALGVVFALRHSRTGRVLIASRENGQAAASLGVNLFRTRLGAFVISGFLAGVAGSLLAYLQRGVPVLTYGPDASVRVFLMTVVGGLGSLLGPVLGAVYLAVATSLPATIAAFMTGGGVLAVLLLAPGGLSQLLLGARDAWLRRVALHHRIDAPSILGDRGMVAGVAPLRPEAAHRTGSRLNYRLGAEERPVDA